MNEDEKGLMFANYRLSKLGYKTVTLPDCEGLMIFTSGKSFKSPRVVKVLINTEKLPEDDYSIVWELKNGFLADIIALADIANGKLWLFSTAEFIRHARVYKDRKTVKFNFYNGNTLANRYSEYLDSSDPQLF